jgi:hypothetical protein
MQVGAQQSQAAMWEKHRLEPHFVRGVTQEKHPVGKVYSSGDKEDPTFKAEIEEVYVVQLANARTGEEHSMVIDPRHPQARDHLKLVQDVIEGRVGGLTPVRMKFEEACALDPEGHEIASSVVDRVAEMESPSLSRGEAAVHMGGEKIGEWTPEVDLAVDRVVSFEVAHSFADQMNEIGNDPESLQWKGIEADAKKAMAREWGGQITDQAEMDRQIARYMPTREDFMAGRHADASGKGIEQSAWDPLRGPMPDTPAEQAQFCCQRALIERFQQRMQTLPRTDANGHAMSVDVVTDVENALIRDGHIPVGRPNRNPEVTNMVVAEKSRAIGTHMLAGYLSMQGANIRNEELASEVKEDHRLHADLLWTLEQHGVPKSEYAKHYFEVARARTNSYRADADNKVEVEARKAMKFPEVSQDKKVNPLEHLEAGVKRFQSVASEVHSEMQAAGEHTETINWDLGR